ncbi:hypothetical protein EDD11_005200 [Mortierella claussenii]|nr:hypothetical protein EDD11_005200 [Mortierella claussenii]
MGPGAALILANLTTLPGFLSEAAIQEARQEYLDQQQQHAQIFVSTSAQPSLSTQHQDSTSYDNTPTVDHNAKIGALLRELQQTSASTQISSSNYSTTVASLPPLTSPQSLSQSSQQAVQEDFSNGKITPQLLKALAALAETDTQQGGILQKEISKLKQQQLATERAMFEERQELLNRQKKDLVKLQAKEIMGMDIKTELQQKQAEHSSELKQFDRRVLRRLDREIKTTQESLANAKVPMMTGTSDPGKIAAQIRVLRLLEDMLQGE